MKFYQIDPIHDSRWAQLVDRHPRASVFHTAAWLKALQNTYGYKPVAFTTSPPTGELANGLVFCRVQSWLTGPRMVSLPFSDHCEPLFDSPEEMMFLVRYLATVLDRQHWKYLEIRPTRWNLGAIQEGVGFARKAKYFLHRLDLDAGLDDLFRSLDKDSIQRRILRADRAGLVESCGTSSELLKDFYGLFLLTRRRQRLPPTPYSWFHNVIRSLGDAAELRVAYHEKRPVAAILTLRCRSVFYYKNGCSDAQFNHLGAMPWLLWRAVESAKSTGATEFDMGRTEENNLGLLRFKNHWVRTPEQLTYWNFPGDSVLPLTEGWQSRVAKYMLSCLPTNLLALTGRLIYRHFG